jgi:sensor histidine kinase YesM
MRLKPEKHRLKMIGLYVAQRFQLTLDRLRIRASLGYVVIIVGSGVGIAKGTGLQGTLMPNTALFWLGYEYAMGMLFVLWQGNRLLWRVESVLRRRFSVPLLKPIMFAVALGGFTAPVALVLSLGWFWLADWPIRWAVVQSMVIWNVLAISVLTFLYETTVLAREREENLLQMEKLKRASIQAELEALKLQLDPHFFFNSLNTLSYLIEASPAEALTFTDNLAEMYRYILQHRNKALVRLSDEMALLQNYYISLQSRFHNSIILKTHSTVLIEDYAIVPLALQLLLENAVKHNEFNPQEPLVVELRIDADAVSMVNGRRPKRVMKNALKTATNNRHHADAGTGLANLDERSKLTTQQRIAVVESANEFFVRVPILRR